MDKAKKSKMKVSKRVLLIFAGIIWSIAGNRVLTIGFKDLTTHTKSPLIYMLISAVIFYVFFTFIFHRMVKKHTKRFILNSVTEHWFFDFFDFKGYIIMVFMIVVGVSLRNSELINPIYIGTFYIGLGTALFLAGIIFLLSALNFEKTKYKYIQ